MKAYLSLLATTALFLLQTALAAAGPPDIVDGRVINRTAGGGPVAGLEVSLRPLNLEAWPERRTTTDNGGNFRFTDLPTTAPISYTLSVNYAGIEYKTPAVNYASGEESKPVELPVYEVSEDSAAIQIDLVHIILEVDPASRTLVVIEFQALSNQGERTYVGLPGSVSGKREALRFPLPREATHVQPIEGLRQEDMVPLGEGFAEATPFLPGKREVSFSYMLEYADRSYTFLRPQAYPAGRLNLLVSDVGAQVRAPGFSIQQTVDIGGKKYIQLSGEGMKQGQPLEIELGGLPLGQGAVNGATENMKLAAMGLLPAAMGATFVYLLLRRRRSQEQPDSAALLLGEERGYLLQSLAELDDSYEAGGIPEPEYRRLRAEKKRRLAELW